MKIYLCGGFKTGWQDVVTAEVLRLRDDAIITDPREHKLHDPGDYTEWNLKQIMESDIVFAYMESTNPGMANLAYELGFAHCLGKKIILINEKGQRWAEMMHQASDVFGDIAGALAALPHMREFRK